MTDKDIGKKMGPEGHKGPIFLNEWQLSRLHDALEDIKQILENDAAYRVVWESFPHRVKFDYTYARWTYQSRLPPKPRFVWVRKLLSALRRIIDSVRQPSIHVDFDD